MFCPLFTLNTCFILSCCGAREPLVVVSHISYQGTTQIVALCLHFVQQITYPSPQYQKIDVLVIGGVPADYQSNPQYLKVSGNHQNTPPLT
jgi:hypothetical protein